MKIKLLTAALLLVLAVQLTTVKAGTLNVVTTTMQLPPPPPHPPHPPLPRIHVAFGHRHHYYHRRRRVHGSLHINLPPPPPHP